MLPIYKIEILKIIIVFLNMAALCNLLRRTRFSANYKMHVTNKADLYREPNDRVFRLAATM